MTLYHKHDNSNISEDDGDGAKATDVGDDDGDDDGSDNHDSDDNIDDDGAGELYDGDDSSHDDEEINNCGCGRGSDDCTDPDIFCIILCNGTSELVVYKDYNVLWSIGMFGTLGSVIRVVIHCKRQHDYKGFQLLT